VSTRVRILSLLLVISVAAMALATAATGRRANLHRAPARVHDVRGPLLRAELPGAGRPARIGAGVFAAPSSLGSALVGSAPVGNGPSTIAINPLTHTIYVANGENANGPNAGGNTVSMIDARHCRARDASGCKGPWPTITVGNLPAGIAVDERTDTVYVANVGDNTVSVFSGARCNAIVTSGCGHATVTVPVGAAPIEVFADAANHTAYVANSGGDADSTTVSMIDSATCNARHLSRCPTSAPPTVDVGAQPFDVDVDPGTHTAYVTTIGALNGWSVFDTHTCNATVRSGCGAIGYLAGDPAGPNAAEVDPGNHTLYTANFDSTLSAFDLRHCAASDLAGCAHETPGTVTPLPIAGFEHVLWVSVDVPLHTVYAIYQKDDSLVAVDTRVCNGDDLAACARLAPPTIHTGADPEMVRLDRDTQTLYTADEVDNDVSVIDATRCNSIITSGCRHPAPSVAVPQTGGLAVDPDVHTTYVTSGASSVSMIDTDMCNAHRLAGCRQTPRTATVGDLPQAIAVDRRTDTVYVANAGSGSSGTVSVIDARTCNATRLAGCANLATLQVPGGNPDDVAVDRATHTVYVATITSSGPDLVSVFNGGTCNATDTGGCDQAPATLTVGSSGDTSGNSILKLALNQATNTIYASNVFNTGRFSPPPFLGDSIYVIDGATCDAATTAGCDQTPATVSTAAHTNPWGIALDEATNTIYTANIADGEHPGTASVINGHTCNGQDTSGCGQVPRTISAGFGSVGVAIDRTTHNVYVVNSQDTSVSVIAGATCSSQNTTDCDQTPTKLAVGDYPSSIAVDPSVATAYVQDSEGVSIIPLQR
jgi:DNA-binding beta-propeller fold protein YncE